MQLRHRIPTIFNLSMVDVLCCALGCVILLWLLNLREARERAATAGETRQRLQVTQSQLEQTTSLLQSAQSHREQLSGDLQAARAKLTARNKEIASLRAQSRIAEERLAKLKQDQQALAKEKADADQRVADLKSQLRDRESLAAATARRVQDLTEEIREAESRAKKLRADVQMYRSQIAEFEARARTLAKEASERSNEVASANRSIDVLQREKRSLASQVEQVRAAAENRFAGITLTGRRVLFLVDMSGSMELIDERTPDAGKWSGVRETLVKVMRSLPDLEKFQVLLFSDHIAYLLGSEGRWLDYDPKTSVGRVLQALAGIKPRGSTNMYDAFESAFRFRSAGLDTIYVLSDGLPNTGPGVSAEQASRLKEPELSDILARYIRDRLKRDWNRDLAGRPRVRINTIGFFYESPDVGAFLWALARENDGSFVGMSKP